MVLNRDLIRVESSCGACFGFSAPPSVQIVSLTTTIHHPQEDFTMMQLLLFLTLLVVSNAFMTSGVASRGMPALLARAKAVSSAPTPAEPVKPVAKAVKTPKAKKEPVENTEKKVVRASVVVSLFLSIISHHDLIHTFYQLVGKTEILSSLHESTGVSKKDIGVVFTGLLDLIRGKVLEEGAEVRLKDFGTFKRRSSAARVGRNPRTGEDIDIPARVSLVFSPSSKVKVAQEE